MLEKSGDFKKETITYKGEKKTVYLHAVMPEIGWIVVTNSAEYDPKDIIGFVSQTKGGDCNCPRSHPTCIQLPDYCICI